MKFHSMKDIAITLMDVADATGFEYELLAECFDELINDGISAEAAVEVIERSFIALK